MTGVDAFEANRRRLFAVAYRMLGSVAEAEEVVASRVRRILQAHPEVRTVDVQRPTPFTIDAPIAVEVRGHDLDVLGRVAEQVRVRMAGIEGLTFLKASISAQPIAVR